MKRGKIAGIARFIPFLLLLLPGIVMAQNTSPVTRSYPIAENVKAISQGLSGL